MSYQLTTGSVKALYNDDKSSPLYNNPIVQVVNIKPVGTTSGTRYRVIISDGVHFMQAMLAACHANLVESEAFKRNSIIRISESVCNILQNRKILIILNLDVTVVDVDSKIGSPATLETANQPTNANSSSPNIAKQETPSAAAPARSSGGFSSGGGVNMQLEASLTPIKNLNPYQTRWTIKARVTQKSPIRKWHNARGDGQLFSVNLLDQTGEIKATAFNDQVDRLYNIFEEGKVYYISKARVTMAKKQFSTLNNEYELGLENGTEIEACGAESAIPQMVYDFVKINDIEKVNKGVNVDVVGVVTEDHGISEIVSKATGKPAKKRELTIADDSMRSIRLTIWDVLAEEFDSSGSPVVAVKGARVNDFNGRSLSLGGAGNVKTNPDTPEATKLQRWYNEVGNSSNFDSYTGGSTMSGGGDYNGVSKKINLQQVKADNLGGSDKPDYFSFLGTVVFVKSENCTYPGCPECKKKLLMEENGWRCEKCQKTFANPEYKYIITLSCEDPTGQIYINGFDEVGQTLLNMSANELMALKDNDTAAATQAFAKALYHKYNFKIRAKTETYNDISRIKYQVIDMKPIDIIKESQELVTAIEELLL